MANFGQPNSQSPPSPPAILESIMWTLREVSKATGYTLDQLRKRLAILAPYLDGEVQRGPRSAIVLSEQAVTILRRMAELEKQGHGLREAAAKACVQVGLNGSSASPDHSGRSWTAVSNNEELLRLLRVVVLLLAILALSTFTTASVVIALLFLRS